MQLASSSNAPPTAALKLSMRQDDEDDPVLTVDRFTWSATRFKLID